MDSHVFYFHEEKQQLVRSYIGSHFLGHANVKETFQSLQAVHGKLDLTYSLVQVSMGIPNVNWKTVEIVKEYREHDGANGLDVIEIGSCGLQVLHSAYGTAQKATDWTLGKLLKAIYSIFKLSPARREDHLNINELLESLESKRVAYLFSLKFCRRRWLENRKALKRAIELHSYFKRYFSYLNEGKKIPPKHYHFTTIDKTGFPLHLATLEYNVYVTLFICNEID